MGERISSLSLSDANGENVRVLKQTSGEFRAERDAVRYRYDVNLSPPAAATTASHVSWRTSDNGVLMLGDLLPLTCHPTARVRLVLPENWKIVSAETKSGDAEYTVADAEQAVFYISRELREQRARINGTDFILGISGTWAFSDKEALSLMRDIINEHVRVTGSALKGRALTVLTPFPSVVGPFAWSAETRGRTVFLLSGQVPSKTAALAHLSVPLAHELFHLWVPNELSLSGDYDWFYEGWTLYQAMRVGMQLGYLNFQDYLDALGRAYNGYRAVKDVTSLSLLDLSKRRWTSGQALVYNKGMLTAFLFDLALRQRARGGHNINSVYRELFNNYNSEKASADANHAIREVLNRMLGNSTFTHAYIETAADIDLSMALRPFGLEVKEAGARVRVHVTKSLTKEQQHLLRGFGYKSNVDSVTHASRIGQSTR